MLTKVCLVLMAIVFLCRDFNRKAVANTVEGPKDLPAAVKLVLDDLDKIIEKVNSTDRSTENYVVSPPELLWLLRAVSLNEREKWAKEFFQSRAAGKKEVYDKLDALSQNCSKKIPTFIPDQSNFINHNEINEAAMKKALPDIAKIRIRQIGFGQKTWDLEENNNHGPQNRSIVGYIWGKNSSDDFVYCRLYQVKVTQDYINGRYGESKAMLLDSWLVGCR